MRYLKHLHVLLLLMVLGCSQGGDSDDVVSGIDKVKPPSPPVRVAQISLKGKGVAEVLYINKCGICHMGRGTGVIQLTQTLGAASAYLATRDNLDKEYVAAVVRNGLGSMPMITRVEVTEKQLDMIVKYLTRNEKSE